MSEFANRPQMDWTTVVEQGVGAGSANEPSTWANHIIGDEAAPPFSIDTAPRYQIQPQTLNETLNATGYDTLLNCQFDTTSISDADGPPAIEFKSGCRVIEYQEPKSRRQRQIEDPQDDRFVCLWSPCKSTRPTFGRIAELQRHYDEQHVRSKVFDCMAVGCPAKGLRGFTRSNKLFIHLEVHHSNNTSFLCPIPQCDVGPFTADLLYVHLNWHDSHVRREYRSLHNSLGAMSFRCPVQDCMRNCIWYYGILDQHDIETRKRDASAILAAGFSPTSGLPLCPVCNAELASGLRFAGPLNTNHLLSHDWESIHEYRREILKVWRGFGFQEEFQQVFEDIMPTVKRKVSY